MNALAAISTPPAFHAAQTPPPTAKVDRDGDHDNGAKETAASERQEPAASGRALNVTA